jgi:hypothetical protein
MPNDRDPDVWIRSPSPGSSARSIARTQLPEDRWNKPRNLSQCGCGMRRFTPSLACAMAAMVSQSLKFEILKDVLQTVF